MSRTAARDVQPGVSLKEGMRMRGRIGIWAAIACLTLAGCANLACDSMRNDGAVTCTREHGR